MNFMSATDINQYNASYCPNQKYYKRNVTNYMKNPKNQVQDFVCDDNASEDSLPIISLKEFVTNNINLLNQTDELATCAYLNQNSRRNRTLDILHHPLYRNITVFAEIQLFKIFERIYVSYWSWQKFVRL